MENISAKSQNQPGQPKNTEIDLIRLGKALWKKKWLIVLCAVLFGCIFYGYTRMFVKPSYRSSFTAYINNKTGVANEMLTSSDIIASQELVKTYSEILTSRAVLTSASETLDHQYSYRELKSMVSTEIENSTEIINIHAIASSPQEAYKVAKAVCDISPMYVSKVVEGSSMRIIDEPVIPEYRYKPDYKRSGILGVALGFALACAYIIIRFFIDDKVSDEKEIEERFKIPVVGIIPDMLSASRDKDKYYYSSYGGYGYASVKAHRDKEKQDNKGKKG